MIATALVSGCGGSDDDVAPTPSKTVIAYDGAIWGIIGSYKCGDNKAVTIGDTNFDGEIVITDPAFVNNPENCTVTFAPEVGNDSYTALDTSNNKNMSNVTYVIPKGMLDAKDEKYTASPFSTLVAKHIGEQAYSIEVATEVLGLLGLSEVANQGGIAIEDLLQDTPTAMAQLKKNHPELHSKTMATTVALSDIQTQYKDATAVELAQVTKNQTTVILKKYPTYPMTGTEGKDEVYVTVKLPADKFEDYKTDDLTDAEVEQESAKLPPATDAEQPVRPTDPDTKPTGGTGGGDGGTGM